MWVVLKNSSRRRGNSYLIEPEKTIEICRIVDSMNDIKSGEIFFKCHTKK